MKFLFTNLLNEGGPSFMYPTLIMLIVCISIIVAGFIKKETSKKNMELLKHISLFALVWGFLGFFLGLIGAFDAIQMHNKISSQVLAGGLKVGLLSPSFGILVFLVSRIGIIALTLKSKE